MIKHGILTRILLCLLLLMSMTGCQRGDTVEPYRFDYFSEVEIPDGITVDNADLILTTSSGDFPSLYLNLAAVQSFREVTFSSYDPWLEEERTFTGVYLYELVRYYGFDEDSCRRIRVIALNGIEASISIKDLKKFHYLLAYQENGKFYSEMTNPEENKGTFAVALDFDAHKDMTIQVYSNHLVWWVQRIEIELTE